MNVTAKGKNGSFGHIVLNLLLVGSLFFEEEPTKAQEVAEDDNEENKEEEEEEKDHQPNANCSESTATSSSTTDAKGLDDILPLGDEEHQVEGEHVEADPKQDGFLASSAMDFEPPSAELVALSRITTMEKLSILCTLINTLNFWDEELLLDGSGKSTGPSSAFTVIAAARESQKRLFKLVNSSDQSRPGLCCAAIRELVRAYPPERLLPAGFLRVVLNNTDVTERPEAYQDSDAANFWEMVMSFGVSLIDEHGNTADQVGSMLLDFLLPALAPEQQPLVEDLEEARGVLRLFLVSHICCRIMYNGSVSGGSIPLEQCDDRSSIHSKGDASVSDLKLEKSTRGKRSRRKKKLWKALIAMAWKKNSTKPWR